jgi:hypothetical protein
VTGPEKLNSLPKPLGWIILVSYSIAASAQAGWVRYQSIWWRMDGILRSSRGSSFGQVGICVSRLGKHKPMSRLNATSRWRDSQKTGDFDDMALALLVGKRASVPWDSSSLD